MPYPQPTVNNAAAQAPMLTRCLAFMCNLLSRYALEVVGDWPTRFIVDVDDHFRRAGGGAVDAIADVGGCWAAAARPMNSSAVVITLTPRFDRMFVLLNLR